MPDQFEFSADEEKAMREQRRAAMPSGVPLPRPNPIRQFGNTTIDAVSEANPGFTPGPLSVSDYEFGVQSTQDELAGQRDYATLRPKSQPVQPESSIRFIRPPRFGERSSTSRPAPTIQDVREVNNPEHEPKGVY